MKFRKIFTFILFFYLLNLYLPPSLYSEDRAYKAEDEEWYPLMDDLEDEGEFFPYNGTEFEIYREQFTKPYLHIYSPDSMVATAELILQGSLACYNKYIDLFNTGSSNPEVHIFLMDTLEGDEGGLALKSHGKYVVLIAGNKPDMNMGHTTIHELMHIFQRAAGIHHAGTTAGTIHSILDVFDEPHASWADARKWFIEGPPQFSPIIVGAPEHMLNKTLLYFRSAGDGRFEQAVKQAHGKSMVRREELACLFWYWYFKKVNGSSIFELTNAFLRYKENGFSNENMDWFNFKSYWHDFALAHINKPGQKTDVFKQIDPDFELVQAGALDNAEHIGLPYGEEITLEPLSQKYFEIDNLEIANGAVVFSLPGKNIPEGLTISAILSKSEGEEEWININLDQQALGEYWVKRFPINGKKYLEMDTDIPYNRIVFVFSNYLDREEVKIKPIFTGTLYRKHAGRGVKTESGIQYTMFGNIPLPGDQHLLKTGEGYRLYTFKDEIRTEARNLWFERNPPLEFGSEDLDKKAMRYVQSNGIFRGKVYFNLKAIIPEEITGTGDNQIEKGIIKVVRIKKENFYDDPDTPNLFKVRVDKQDLLIMFGGDPKTVVKFVNVIEKIVQTKYEPGTYGHTLSQLFQQTIAIDTRQYNQEYDVKYKRGKDENGPYLMIKLGESMWFYLRHVPSSADDPDITAYNEHIFLFA